MSETAVVNALQTAGALETLYVQNRGLLAKMANRYARMLQLRGDIDTEDLIQAGYFGLVAAARTFTEDAGKTWAGWASWYIMHEQRRCLGFKTAVDAGGCPYSVTPPAVAYLDQPLSDDGDAATMGDLLADESAEDPQERAELLDLCERVRAAVDALPAAEADAIRRVDLNGECVADIAREKGLDYGKIIDYRRKGHNALRRSPDMVKLAREHDLDRHTNFYRHKGVAAFRYSTSSDTEDSALWRIEQRERYRQQA